MKQFFLFALCLAAHFGFSQQITFNPDSISYQISDTNLSAGKTDLHRKAQAWVIEKFGDAKEVIRLDDMDTGELTGEGFITLENKNKQKFNFKVSSRDREYSLEVFHIGGDGGTKQKSAELDRKMRSMLKDFDKRMKSGKNFAQPSVDTIPSK